MSIPKKPRLETAMTFLLPEQVNVEQSSHDDINAFFREADCT